MGKVISLQGIANPGSLVLFYLRRTVMAILHQKIAKVGPLE
jgi:hypothetical protein